MRALCICVLFISCWLALFQPQLDPFVDALIQFTNVKCTSLNSTVIKVRDCALKMKKRELVVLNMYVELLQKPLNNLIMTVELFRKTNGYTPYLYSFNVDFCKFMLNPGRQPVLNEFFKTLSKQTNFNHSCPFDHDIIIDNMIVQDNILKVLPFPKGDYMVDVRAGSDKLWLFDIKSYVSVSIK